MGTLKLCLVMLLVNCVYNTNCADSPKEKFRKDYTYLEATDAFYKFHTLPKKWNDAKKRCQMEGSSLFYPINQEEVDEVLKLWKETQPISFAYIGISAMLDPEVFLTVDGRPLFEVFNKWSPGEPNNGNGDEHCVILRREGTLDDYHCDHPYPFICKKLHSGIVWNRICDLPDTDYVYNPTLGHCYKYHTDRKNWTDALAACNIEQSYLAIIDSKKEHDYFVELTKRVDKKDNPEPFVHLGFHKMGSDEWKTIKRIPLSQTGYPTWAGNQPDNAFGHEHCGSMFLGGGLNDLSCDIRTFYICEHEVAKKDEDIDERFNDLLLFKS